MLMHRFVAIAHLCFLLTLAAGCSSSPTSRFYTLSAGATPPTTKSNLSVAVGPVTVPEVVDRPQIVVSSGPNQVRLEEFNRWALPLQNSIALVVVENLSALLGTSRVIPSSLTASEDAEYRVVIDVQRFDSAPGKAATLDAVWTVRRTRDGKSETGRTTQREAVEGDDYDALAAGHSRALARLSRDLADALRALNNSGQ